MTSTLNSVRVKQAQSPGSPVAGSAAAENEAGVPDVTVLYRLGEHFAAGYFELPGASPMRRWSRAERRRFEQRILSGDALLTALARDFGGDEPLRQRLCHCPRFGNDIAEVDALAAELACFVS